MSQKKNLSLEEKEQPAEAVRTILVCLTKIRMNIKRTMNLKMCGEKLSRNWNLWKMVSVFSNISKFVFFRD